jgi:hypothetical protein
MLLKKELTNERHSWDPEMKLVRLSALNQLVTLNSIKLVCVMFMHSEDDAKKIVPENGSPYVDSIKQCYVGVDVKIRTL